MTGRSAIIIGAGIAGLSAAIALKQAGYKVVIHDRAPKLLPLGAALSIWPNALAALDRLGCGDALRAVAHPFDEVGLSDWQGRDLARFSPSMLSGQEAARLPTRAALQAILLEATKDIPLHLGEGLTEWGQDAQAAWARFDTGRAARADLLVIADGIWSTAATDIIGNAPHHCGYGGVLAISSAEDSDAALPHAIEYWGPGRFGIFAVGGGKHYWFYMRNERDPAESRALTLTQVAEAVADGPGPVQAVIGRTDAKALIPFSIHTRSKPSRLGKGRIICVGDAAHAMEPNMGQGACQAIEDAVALGIAATQWPAPDILPRFESMRMKRIRRVMMMSHQGAIIPHHLPKFLHPMAHSVVRATSARFSVRMMADIYRLPDYG